MSGKAKFDKPSVPAWVLTYGDMMSLLLTFFILLVSFSSIQESKYKQAYESILNAFGMESAGRTPIIVETPPAPGQRNQKLEEMREQIKEFKAYVHTEGLDSVVSIEQTEGGVLIRMEDPLLFDTGKADLKPAAFGILDKLVVALATVAVQINIQGHTDDVPISNERFPSNWELSATRAVQVLKFLNGAGIAGAQLSAVGYGEWRPIAPNDSEENRGRNRRVEIYLDYRDAIEREAIQRMFFEEDHNG